MNITEYQGLKFVLLMILVLLMASCSAGNDRFIAEHPAGFWFGLWHGMISFISLIVRLFNENVAVYELDNTGGWYDFGFLLGVTVIWGGSSHVTRKSVTETKRDKEWDDIIIDVEKKVMRNLKEWAQDENSSDNLKDWEDISEKVEKKLKRKIREWAEKD